MKKLLAEEMSKETEPKRRTPSVIARLMGLDGLPPQQPLHRQHKGFSETYQQRAAFLVSDRNGKSREHRLNRKVSMDQKEYKDVYEVPEISKIGSDPAKGILDPKLSGSLVAFTQPRLMDAKCPSTNERLYSSRESCDTLDLLNANKDQQPDPLFKKHLLDLQGSAPRSQCSRISVIKSSDSENYESNTIGWKSDKGTSSCDTSSYWKHGRSTHFGNHCGAQEPFQLSKVQLEGKHKTDILPTRIVVLKPNFEKVQNATKFVSSPYSSDSSKHMECQNVGTVEAGSQVKKNLPSDLSFLESKSRESRKIAKEITKRVRESLGSELVDLSSILRGYAGDESSYNMSGSDSTSESDVTMLSSRQSFHRSNRSKPPSLSSPESCLTKEATNRLSERWKTSQRFQDVEAMGKGGTLGDMLAISDREMSPKNLGPVVGSDWLSDKFSGNEENAEWDSPLGISSRDGWKDGYVRNSSRLKSISASSVGFGGLQAGTKYGTLDQDGYLMPAEVMNEVRNNGIKKSFKKKEDYASRNFRACHEISQSHRRSFSDNPNFFLEEKQFSHSQMKRSCNKTSQSHRRSFSDNIDSLGEKQFSHSQTKRSCNKTSQSHCRCYSDSTDSLEEKQFNHSQKKINPGRKHPPEQPLASKMPTSNVDNTGLITDIEVDAKSEEMTRLSESPIVLPPKPSPCLLGNCNFPTPVPEDSILQIHRNNTETTFLSPGPSEESAPLQYPVPEPSSPASSKEAVHLSPDSVLDIPFTEEVLSRSECFERVSADLDELRMQLKLLKMDSGGYSDGGVLISSDQDVGQQSLLVSEEEAIFEDSTWESSYLVNALIDSGLDDADPDTIVATWHSSDCPLGPSVFDNLEKQYCSEPCSRSERKLLFDRTNSGLLEIFQPFMDPFPWVKLPTRKLSHKWPDRGLKYKLRKLLAREEKRSSEGSTEAALDGEMQWLDFADDIDAIGKELEKLIIDEFITEVANM
ncbi:uncharacterized protein LOC127790618 isoform X2 [Diospyros lotus]|nr:uncharacterized protein LOC127790618 isoform X2 [Diospyros lotus]